MVYTGTAIVTSGLVFSLHPRYRPLGPPGPVTHHALLCGAHSLCSQEVSCLQRNISYFRGLFSTC